MSYNIHSFSDKIKRWRDKPSNSICKIKESEKTDRFEWVHGIDPYDIEILDNKTNVKLYTLREITETLNELNDDRDRLAESYDFYQARIGYVLGVHGRKYNRDSKEFKALERLAEDLHFDTESFEAKDGYG